MDRHDRSRRPARRTLALAALAAIAVVLSACQTMPESGMYSSVQYTDAQLTITTGQTYATATDYQGATVALGLDVYVPPSIGTPRPTIVLVHGGGFVGGSRSSLATAAKSYARRGFVVVNIDYRVNPNAQSSEALYLQTALNAIDDGMEAVRWTKAHAATYGIDVTRIAVVGSSAGGAIALGIGDADDPTPGGPLAAQTTEIAAAVSTGATLTPGIPYGMVTFEATDAPALMFHYETDSVTGFTDEYAKETCDGLVAVGVDCRFVVQAGRGHTVSISPADAYWTSDIGTFLWRHLRLFPDT